MDGPPGQQGGGEAGRLTLMYSPNRPLYPVNLGSIFPGSFSWCVQPGKPSRTGPENYSMFLFLTDTPALPVQVTPESSSRELTVSAESPLAHN
jgi:hypothetical protein